MPKGSYNRHKLESMWDQKNPMIGVIEQLYQRNGLFSWDNARVSALAQRLHLNVYTLCAAAGLFINHGSRSTKTNQHHAFNDFMVDTFWKRNSWPAYLAVQFDHWERVLNEQPAFHVQDLIMTKLITDKTYGRPANSGGNGKHPGTLKRDFYCDPSDGSGEGADDGGGMRPLL